MASILLCAGTPGQRRALPNARVMIHQPSGGAQGQATDIAIRAQEILSLRERLNQIYVEHTHQVSTLGTLVNPSVRPPPNPFPSSDTFGSLLHPPVAILCPQPLSLIEERVDRDHFMSADQAKEFGILDEVIQKRPESEE